MTNEQIRRLPTLAELVKELKRRERDELEATGGWTSATHPIDRIIPIDSFYSPDNAFYNKAGEDDFIVTFTQKGRTVLKPNLKRHLYLYRGQNRMYDAIISSFNRTGKGWTIDETLDYRLRHNLKTEEFIRLLRTHPIFMLLDRGIYLEPAKDPFFIDMNYYGLSQHYGFKTGVVDFTTDIDVAAFFAATRYKGEDVYEPLTSASAPKYGVIYRVRIHPQVTFKLGFSTIGLQLYPRSGAQKGVLWNETDDYLTIGTIAEPHPFRHDSHVSRHCFDLMKEGKQLFPEDTISPIAQKILQSNEIPGQVFARNLYCNQEDMRTNLERLERSGMTVRWDKISVFTPDTLKPFYEDLKNGLWENFCNRIYFGGSEGARLRESMLRIPANPHYRHFFDLREWSRFQHLLNDEVKRADLNRIRKDRFHR